MGPAGRPEGGGSQCAVVALSLVLPFKRKLVYIGSPISERAREREPPRFVPGALLYTTHSKFGSKMGQTQHMPSASCRA